MGIFAEAFRGTKPRISIKIMLTMLLLVIPLNLICLVSVLEYIGHYEERTQAGLQNLTDVFMNTIDAQAERANLFLYDLVSESPECAALERWEKGTPEYENAKYQCYRHLSGQLDQEKVISGYYVIPKKSGESILSTHAFLPYRKELEGYVTDTSQCDNRWHVRTLGSGKVMIRSTSARGFYYGAVLDLRSREKELEAMGGYESRQAFFSEEPAAKNPGWILASTCSDKTGLYLTLQADRRESLRGVSFYHQLMIAAAFVLLLAAPLSYRYLQRQVVFPLRRLNEAFGKVEGGDRRFTLAIAADTVEFQEAYDSFNRMVASMEDLRLDVMEKELEKKQLELDNLRLQIRPHFLMNTFNLIYFLLRSPEGMEKARELILYLSDYFRYLLRGDNNRERFDKELSLIEGYVDTAKLRYPGRLSFTSHIEPEVRVVLVPPLLIHNFVENVVKHSLTLMKHVHMDLTAFCQEGRAVFEISDDGNGMSPGMVRIINTGDWEDAEGEGHVGIRNAVRRLEALYGEEGRVQVSSQLGEGTLVRISFPCETKEP